MSSTEAVPGGLRRIVLTGGRGFLGRAIVRALREGRTGLPAPEEIVTLDLVPPGPDDTWDNTWDGTGSGTADDVRTVSLVGDVCDLEAVRGACEGADVVVHTAALIDWGSAGFDALERVNVGGTRNVLQASREAGVRGVVHTSTMDVLMGEGPIRDVDESRPYPQRYADGYARTKASAERLALAANGDGLRTCVLRPCGMFGERDPYHMSNTIRAASSGSLRFRIGDGSAVFQHVYVGNVAHAHVLAAHRLLEPDSLMPGEVYIVTDEPARNFFDFMEPIITRLGLPFPPRNRTVPFPVAHALGAVAEVVAGAVAPFVSWQSPITRSSVRVLCEDVSFETDKAERHFGYRRAYSHEEAVARTVDWFAEHRPVPSTVPANG